MIKEKETFVEEYNYSLPETLVAKYPLEERDKSKLLVYRNSNISSKSFSDLSKIIDSGSVLVFNNTRVVQARLIFHKKTGAKIKIFCLEPFKPSDYEQSFSSKGESVWKCLVGNAKKWKEEEIIKNFAIGKLKYSIKAEKLGIHQNSQLIRFRWPSDMGFGEILEAAGLTPIPPYLGRDSDDKDKYRYQTLYSLKDGSVAAPTAGLHFTQTVLNSLNKNNIKRLDLTLHIGAGTFRPVSSNRIGDHEMHSERIIVSKEFINNLLNIPGKIITVGTTSMRCLESIYWLGIKILSGLKIDPENIIIEQWEPYEKEIHTSLKESFKGVSDFLELNKRDYVYASTKIIICPGYKFRVSSGLLTNFHMPKSTLLMLIAALIGKDWKKVYNYALENKFRFLSYGDSSILLPGSEFQVPGPGIQDKC